MKTITSAFLLFISLSVHSQNVAFPLNEAIWNTWHKIPNGITIPIYLSLCGDTVIEGKNYSKLYWGLGQNWQYWGALRSQGDSVWHLSAMPPAPEYLLYDFSLVPGEQITLTFANGLMSNQTVDSIGTTLVNGEPRKTIYFLQGPNAFYQEYWVEGIGSSKGLLDRGQLDNSGSFYLLCFWHDGTFFNPELFPWQECEQPETPDCTFLYNATNEANTATPLQLLAHPNPSAGIVTWGATDGRLLPAWRLSLFDAHGRRWQVWEGLAAPSVQADLSGLPPGLLFWRLTEQGTNATLGSGKIVKSL